MVVGELRFTDKFGLCPATRSVNNQVCLKNCKLLRSQEENANKHDKYILVTKACGFVELPGDFQQRLSIFLSGVSPQ